MLVFAILFAFFALVIGDDKGCKRFPPTVDLGTPLPAPVSQVFDFLDEILKQVIADNKLIGGALSFRYNGKELFSTGKGLADISKGTPFTSKTKTRVASVSKLHTTLLLNQFASMDIMNIHDPVNQWCPTFSVPSIFSGTWKEGANGITFAQLASHLSGLQRESPGHLTTAEIFDMLRTSPLVVPPGSVPSYSNLGFSLLGNALADCVHTNASYPMLLDHLIVHPLGLKNTGSEYTPEVMDTLAKGYVGLQEVDFVDLGWSTPAGGLYSSVEDMAILGEAILADSARDINPAASPLSLGIRPELARDLLRPVSRNPDGYTYIGAPWEMMTFNIASESPDVSTNDATDDPSYLRNKDHKIRNTPFAFSDTVREKLKEIKSSFIPYFTQDPNYTGPIAEAPTLHVKDTSSPVVDSTNLEGKSYIVNMKGPTKGANYVVRMKE